MADVATPSGATMFDGGAQDKKKGTEKPEKPDEEVYKANLKKAEKEHADSMVKLVCAFPYFEVGLVFHGQREPTGDKY